MPSAKPTLQFWYDFSSSYAYLCARRIDGMAQAAGVTITWRAFVLGPIFKAQGWDSSPFNLFPAKGRYMQRDIARTARLRGIGFRLPDKFPANSYPAARIALIAEDEGWVRDFSLAVFIAVFERGEEIGDPACLRAILATLGQDATRLLAAQSEAASKLRLKERTQQAQDMGIFGAPSFIAADGELFWGDDRLEQALAWARNVA
jgi:2-hydroxychromene-2-carboxylate isomerase